MKKLITDYIDLECDCGHNGYLRVCLLGDGQIELNFRNDKRKKWDGVVVNREDFEKIMKFYNEKAS